MDGVEVARFPESHRPAPAIGEAMPGGGADRQTGGRNSRLPCPVARRGGRSQPVAAARDRCASRAAGYGPPVRQCRIGCASWPCQLGRGRNPSRMPHADASAAAQRFFHIAEPSRSMAADRLRRLLPHRGQCSGPHARRADARDVAECAGPTVGATVEAIGGAAGASPCVAARGLRLWDGYGARYPRVLGRMARDDDRDASRLCRGHP